MSLDAWVASLVHTPISATARVRRKLTYKSKPSSEVLQAILNWRELGRKEELLELYTQKM